MSTVSTANVDPEISTIAGPQLVVPVTNARYSLNAANARWGSLYDALYGTDAIPEEGRGRARRRVQQGPRRPRDRRRPRVSSIPRRRLPAAATAMRRPMRSSAGALAVTLQDGSVSRLADPSTFAGYTGDIAAPSAVLLKNNGLHIDISIDRSHPIGRGRRGRG